MTDETEDLGDVDLHIAGTRPWMLPVLNVSWTSMVLLVGITAELATLNWHLVVFAIPLWPAALWVFRQDHNGLRVIGAWLMTAGLDLRASVFGATSIEVFPSTYRGQFRGIASA